MNRPQESTIREDNWVKMSWKIGASIITSVVVIVTFVLGVYYGVQGHLGSIDLIQSQLATRTSLIEAAQAREHDKLIRMDDKLDFLVGGRKGTPPPTN